VQLSPGTRRTATLILSVNRSLKRTEPRTPKIMRPCVLMACRLPPTLFSSATKCLTLSPLFWMHSPPTNAPKRLRSVTARSSRGSQSLLTDHPMRSLSLARPCRLPSSASSVDAYVSTPTPTRRPKCDPSPQSTLRAVPPRVSVVSASVSVCWLSPTMMLKHERFSFGSPRKISQFQLKHNNFGRPTDPREWSDVRGLLFFPVRLCFSFQQRP
jgi:hypothetical protein